MLEARFYHVAQPNLDLKTPLPQLSECSDHGHVPEEERQGTQGEPGKPGRGLKVWRGCQCCGSKQPAGALTEVI